MFDSKQKFTDSFSCAGCKVDVLDSRPSQFLLRITHDHLSEHLDIAVSGGRFFVASAAGVWPCPGDLPETKRAPIGGHECSYQAHDLFDWCRHVAMDDESQEQGSKLAYLLQELARWHAISPPHVRLLLYKIYEPRWGVRKLAKLVGLGKTQTAKLCRDLSEQVPELARLLCKRVS